MTESVTVKTRPSLFARMLRTIVGLALLLGIGVLVFAAWANHRRDGEWTFRVFDRTWWGIGRQEAKPYVDGAKTAARTAYETTEELLLKAEAWLKRPPAEHAADPSSSATPVEDLTARNTTQEWHEKGFAQAQDLFEEGVIAYRQGKPTTADTPPDAAALRTAIAYFKRVRDILDSHIPGYNALPTKNLRILADAEELQALNLRMLSTAEKLARP